MADNEIDYQEDDASAACARSREAIPNVRQEISDDSSSAINVKPFEYRAIKRIFDIVMGVIVLLIAFMLLPLTLIVLAVVAMQTGGSPIYIQERVGREGRSLRIYKVRTMVADSDNVERYLSEKQLEQWRRERKVDDDPRIVSVGRILRKTSLDELPQFLNVLAGQMSVIGPRPITKDELVWFGEEAALVLSVPPGITGWWQVSSRNNATFESGERQALELYYARNANLCLDAKIFLLTFRSILGGTGQ